MSIQTLPFWIQEYLGVHKENNKSYNSSKLLDFNWITKCVLTYITCITVVFYSMISSSKMLVLILSIVNIQI